MDWLEDRLNQEIAKSEMIDATDKQVIEEYERRAVEVTFSLVDLQIASLNELVTRESADLESFQERIKTLEESWILTLWDALEKSN